MFHPGNFVQKAAAIPGDEETDPVGHKAEIRLRPDMPTGPVNRVADNVLARRLLNWEPKTTFREGPKNDDGLVFRHRTAQKKFATYSEDADGPLGSKLDQ